MQRQRHQPNHACALAQQITSKKVNGRRHEAFSYLPRHVHIDHDQVVLACAVLLQLHFVDRLLDTQAYLNVLRCASAFHQLHRNGLALGDARVKDEDLGQWRRVDIFVLLDVLTEGQRGRIACRRTLEHVVRLLDDVLFVQHVVII